MPPINILKEQILGAHIRESLLLAGGKNGKGARLYHYTSMDGVFSILREGYLRATEVNFLNDRKEIEFCRELALDQFRKSKLAKKVDAKIFEECMQSTKDLSTFVLCLSARSDSLPQWMLYADGGRGVNISFNVANFVLNVEKKIPHILLLPVHYGKVKTRAFLNRYFTSMAEEIDKAQIKSENSFDLERTIVMHLFSIMSAFKDISFQTEHEYRLVIHPRKDDRNSLNVNFFSRRTSVCPYLKIPISGSDVVSGVRLGPLSRNEKNKISLKMYAASLGYGDLGITESRSPYGEV